MCIIITRNTRKKYAILIIMNYWQEKVIIGTRAYPRFIGGPLDGYTDSPFRQLVREFSPHNLLYTQMRHVSSIAHARAVVRELQFDQCERPLNFQIATNTVTGIARAVERILATVVDGIDLNIACPAKNVVKSKSGSAIMADLKLLEQILRALRAASTVPVTVKMRAGFKEKNALAVAQLVQDCGIDALAIHPRLQTQKFGGAPDYALVRSIKNELSIPVLYSGGINTFVDAQSVHEQTGTDGFLIGRGMCGAPWKLAELEAHARGDDYLITSELRAQTAKKHLALLCDYYGTHGLYQFRKHIPFYIAACAGASDARKKLLVLQAVEQVIETLNEFFGVAGGKKA